MAKTLPSEFKKYFWDTRFDQLDPWEDRALIIERVINWGNLRAARWLFANYPAGVIIQNLIRNYNISNHAANLWAPLLEIPVTHCACNRRPSHLRVFDW